MKSRTHNPANAPRVFHVETFSRRFRGVSTWNAHGGFVEKKSLDKGKLIESRIKKFNLFREIKQKFKFRRI